MPIVYLIETGAARLQLVAESENRFEHREGNEFPERFESKDGSLRSEVTEHLDIFSQRKARRDCQGEAPILIARA